MSFEMKINNATQSRRRKESTRLMVLEGELLKHKLFCDLPEFLKRGDILVVNDAATLPSSLKAQLKGEPVEIRLVQAINPFLGNISQWRAVLLGAGDWQTPTEKRTLPPRIFEGDTLNFELGLKAKVIKVERNISERLLQICFSEEGPTLWGHLYGQGRPIQYSYLTESLNLWDQQTIFSGPPVAVEPPSASFAFTWRLVKEIEDRGVTVLKLTHATGISNTGDSRIDLHLPFSEPSLILPEVQTQILEAKKSGHRIIAAGTGVVRALEGWGGQPNKNGAFINDLKIGSNHKLKMVDGLLTGLHEPGGSHLKMLSAFASEENWKRFYAEASAKGYLWHEYGDLCLVA